MKQLTNEGDPLLPPTPPRPHPSPTSKLCVIGKLNGMNGEKLAWRDVCTQHCVYVDAPPHILAQIAAGMLPAPSHHSSAKEYRDGNHDHDGVKNEAKEKTSAAKRKLGWPKSTAGELRLCQ